MNCVNKTMYIPLYGKAYVSKKGIILSDKKAEEIWSNEGFPLKGKSKSKWLAYFMGMRAAVYDRWAKEQMEENPDAAVLHIGCGMDRRVLRIGDNLHKWYDIDFPEVISERKLYYAENENYKMLVGDARKPAWLSEIPDAKVAVVIFEGISMYLAHDEIKNLFSALSSHFEKVVLLIDCYTTMAAKISKYKNPINEVGVTKVYGTDTPSIFDSEKFKFVKEHNMTPNNFINELCGIEKFIFKTIFGGSFSKKMYRMFEYKSA